MIQDALNKMGGAAKPTSVHGDTGRAEELIRCRMCQTLLALPYAGSVRCHECGHEINWLGRYSRIPKSSVLIDDLLPTGQTDSQPAT